MATAGARRIHCCRGRRNASSRWPGQPAGPAITSTKPAHHWLAQHGINGIRLQALLDHLKTIQLAPADAILLSMGVNDTTGLTPRRRYRQQLLALGAQLPGPLFLLSVPPMHRFTALPTPLRQLLGWRARQLDAVQRKLAAEQPDDFIYLATRQ